MVKCISSGTGSKVLEVPLRALVIWDVGCQSNSRAYLTMYYNYVCSSG